MEDVAVPRRRLLARRRSPDPHALVVATITEYADSLLRVARNNTTCAADAEDAYQRAMEIFVRHAARLEPATAHKWLHKVVKHEAWAVAERRAREVAIDDESALAALDDGRHAVSVEERSERFEALARAAEALKRLKPHEVTALVLKAQGLSYQEIAARENWTYTKVNRCITEGRRAFLARYEGIESGAECERWLPVLSAMADGEASAAHLVDARPHLRNCAACRSVLGAMHRSSAPVAALLPPALLGGGGACAGGGLLDRLGELVLGVQERIVAPLARAQGALEAASSTKLAAVAASTAALAGGGVAVERQASLGAASAAERPGAVKRAVPTGAEERDAVAATPLRPAGPAGAVAAAGTSPADQVAPRPARTGSPERGDRAPAGAEFAAEATATRRAATVGRAATPTAEPAPAPAPARQAPRTGPSPSGGEFDLGG